MTMMRSRKMLTIRKTMSTTTKNLMIETLTQIKKKKRTRQMRSKKSKKTSQRNQERLVGVTSLKLIKGCDRSCAKVAWNHSLQALPSTLRHKAATRTNLPTLTKSKSPPNSSQTTLATSLKRYRFLLTACTRYTPRQPALLSETT